MSEAELEQHLRAHPEDEAAWLIYGDLLSAQGDPRGELIALEHEVQSRRKDPKLAALYSAQIAEFRRDWAGPLKRWRIQETWRRGHVERLTLDADVALEEDWPSALAQLFGHRCLRFLQRLTLMLRVPKRDEWAKVFAVIGRSTESLAIKALHLDRNNIAEKGMEALADSPLVECLERLELGSSYVGSLGLERFFGRVELSTLKSLSMWGQMIETRGLLALAHMEAPKLEQLTLSSCAIDDSALQLLSREGEFPKLKTFELGGNDVSESGLEALLRAPGFSGLIGLGLRMNRLSERSLQILSASALGAQLEHLDLSDNRFGEGQQRSEVMRLHQLSSLKLAYSELSLQDACALIASIELPKLRVLDLSRTRLQPGRALRAKGFAELHALSLSFCMLQNAGLELVLETFELRQLNTLDVRGNRLTGKGVIGLLTRLQNAPVLDLNLSFNQVGVTGTKALVRSQLGSGLQTLSLQACGLTEKSIKALAKSSSFGSLRQLDLRSNMLTEGAFDALLDAPWLGGLESLKLDVHSLSKAQQLRLSKVTQIL